MYKKIKKFITILFVFNLLNAFNLKIFCFENCEVNQNEMSSIIQDQNLLKIMKIFNNLNEAIDNIKNLENLQNNNIFKNLLQKTLKIKKIKTFNIDKNLIINDENKKIIENSISFLEENFCNNINSNQNNLEEKSSYKNFYNLIKNLYQKINLIYRFHNSIITELLNEVNDNFNEFYSLRKILTKSLSNVCFFVSESIISKENILNKDNIYIQKIFINSKKIISKIELINEYFEKDYNLNLLNNYGKLIEQKLFINIFNEKKSFKDLYLIFDNFFKNEKKEIYETAEEVMKFDIRNFETKIEAKLKK